MGSAVAIDLFVEDRAHEELLRPVIDRRARDFGKSVVIRVRAARGGHGKVLAELDLYQKSVLRGAYGLTMPDALVIGYDSNCSGCQEVRKAIRSRLDIAFRVNSIIACPEPHIERWYLAETAGFFRAVGVSHKVGRKKCERDFYKRALLQAVRDAGHLPTLGGIEFAQEIVAEMDFYAMSKAEGSFKAFLVELDGCLKRV